MLSRSGTRVSVSVWRLALGMLWTWSAVLFGDVSDEVMARVRDCFKRQAEVLRHEFQLDADYGEELLLSAETGRVSGRDAYVVWGSGEDFEQVLCGVWVPPSVPADVAQLLLRRHFQDLVSQTELWRAWRERTVERCGVNYKVLYRELCYQDVPFACFGAEVPLSVRQLACGEAGTLYVTLMSHEDVQRFLDAGMEENVPLARAKGVLRLTARVFLKKLLLQELTGRAVWSSNLRAMMGDFLEEPGTGQARMFRLYAQTNVSEVEALRYVACRSWLERAQELGLSPERRAELRAMQDSAETSLRGCWGTLSRKLRQTLERKWPELSGTMSRAQD